MSALNAALCRRGIILWLAAVLLLASRSTHSAPVYDQDTTQIAEYDAATVGCYFNFQRYQEGDRIMTSEPCLNCTCHNRMLMCYLKVCPFTKAIGQDCTVEKRPDQCCPVITCPEVPVQLLTSTTSAPAGSDSTELGFHDNYGCHVDQRFYADGAMLPVDHHNPCELCYCIRNRTTCVMQECTLRVAGCKPVYQPGVCCPIKYDCEYDEESSTTVSPTPGLIMTTTLPPGVLPQCYYENNVYEDGDLINSSQPCQHCYCFHGEIACAVQNCGTPMQAHGKNCTALPPPEGECCPTTYQCEEQGILMLPEEGEEEQVPEQTPHEEQIMTESPMIIDQEDQQVKDEHPQEETFPGADNAIPLTPEGEEEKGVQGTIEHVTTEQILTTEKSEEQPATPPTEETVAPETETTTAEKESTLLPEHDTKISSAAVTPEILTTTRVSSEIAITNTEASTSQQTEESLITETPTAKLPEASSTLEGLQPQEEAITTEHISEEHISTEESVPEKEHSTLVAGIPETSTEIVEKTTGLIAETEESGIVPESATEQTKEDKIKVETTSGETLATETEPSVEKETVTVSHEVPSTEQIEIEEPQLTEISPPKEQPTEEEQKPVTDKDKEEQHPKPEQPTSEHAIIKEELATVGAKKEDFGLTESPDISKLPVTVKERVEEESTPEIPAQGPTGIPIPERSPVQKAEDENIYHVTDDYGVTRPEVSSDNLLTKPTQRTPTTYLPQEQEIPLTTSKEIQKPIEEEDLEVPKETIKPISEEVTEINLSTQRKPEITEITTEETKAETTPIIKTETSTETLATTIAAVEHIPKEKTPEEIEKPSVSEELETEIPEGEVQSTEKIPSDEEIPTKGLEVSGETSSSEEVSGEQDEKKVQPKKEQPSEEEAGTQFPAIEFETPVFIPGQEHSTVLPSLGEYPTEGEVTTIISLAPQSTQVPQVEEKTEIVTAEEEKPTIGEKPLKEHITEQSITSSGITSSEEEKELQTTESISKEEQTTEVGEKFTTQVSAGEEQKTEQPEQYSTEKAPEEPTVTQEVEGAEGIPTKVAEQTEATVIEKEPSTETEVKPTDITETQQTELPAIVEHSTKIGEAEKEGEEKIPTTTGIQTEIPATETGSTEAPILEQQTEKTQTEPSVTERLPSQPPVPLDRKEDQEFVEPIIEEEQASQITQKPSLDEKEVFEIYEEPQKPIISSEVEGTHVPPLKEIITESAPEEKPTEIAGTTELISAGERVTQPPVKQQSEVASVQPETETELPEQKEQTQEPVIKEQPEEVLTIETTSATLASEASEEPITSKIDEGKSTAATASEGTTISGLIFEVSTELIGLVEEHTESEIPIEGQPETHEETTQLSTTEEKPSKGETEEVSPKVSTEKSVETSEVSISEKQPQEEKEIPKESTETPEVYSTLAPEETPQKKVTTEVSQHLTELPTKKESSTEKESIPEITLRPSGIPGEGNCLVEGQSYNNNSAVPPANFCQTSCRCVSSIVQCELVQCPAPPTHSNCMPVYGAEQCCPIYACGDANAAELESDSHKIESPEEEDQKITPTTELLTEAPVTEITIASKEFSTVVVEISTPESQPVEITVSSLSPSEEEITEEITERQLTTTEFAEQPTTIRPVKQHPEEQSISPVFETSQEPITQVPEEKEHTVSEESIKEGETGETVTKLTVSTEQPVEEQTTISGEEQQVITSTNIPLEQELHGTGEGPSDLHKEEVTISTASAEQETSPFAEIETSTSAEGSEVPTIAPSKEEESTTTIIEQETLSEKNVKEQSTFKPIAEDNIEQPKEEEIQLIPISEEPITTEKHEISTKPEEETVTEKLPAKPEVLEEQTTVEPSEYESTSVSEIQPTTEQKPKETEYKEEKEQETVTLTEGEQAVETEIPESQTKLPITIASAKVEEPIELTTLVHDYASSEAPSESYTTAKLEEVFTEESKGETKPTISTEALGIEEEHATTPGLVSETPSEKPAKPIEESIPEISQKGASSETVRPTENAEIETTEHPKQHPELSVTEGEPSVTKLPTEFTEPNIVHESESTHVPIEVHPEITTETESHTSESPEEQTISEEVLTTSALPESEQPTKETVPSLDKEQTEQSVIPEVESGTPVIKEEHVTTPTEEQTPKSVEQVSVEEQTVALATFSEGEAMEQITPESVTIQEEQKTTESAKPETELPGVTEEQTAGPEIHKEKEEQKPETEIKEEPITIPEITEAPKEKTTEEGVTSVSITEGQPSVEEHITPEEATLSTVETDVISHQPIETTTAQEEQGPEEEGHVTSEISLPQHSLSEETTSQIFGEHPAASTERPHEYETTSIAEEEVSKPVTEISVETLLPEKESATIQGLKPEEPVTRISEISLTEKPTEALPETEKPVQQEQETELPEKGETTTKLVEGITSEEKLPEELEAEIKSTKAPISEEEEAPSTAPYPIEATSVQTEEQPLITKLQPTEQYLPSLPPQEIQPTQPEESEEAHTSVTEEGQPRPQESQSTTEKLLETEQTGSSLETTVSTESSIKVSSVPAEFPEEKTTIKPSPEEPETQAPLRPEEGPQTTAIPEEILIKTQSTELPSDTTEKLEISEEEVPSQESEEGSHEQPGPVDTSHFHEDGGSYLTPDEDYDEDDQLYGPGTCRYGGKVYVSAQQIPRDDPCDFCFCFRSDIICLQQSCPPPIPGCHEEPISGFCCPRYECPVSMATALNLTTTTTTTTTTLPPHFHAHAYKGAARRSGCQIDGHAYRVGQIITSQSGPCTRCICRGDGKMNCEPLLCSPEPMLKQMIAAATAKRRR